VPPEPPPLVQRAYELANAIGFALTREEAGPDRPSACLPGTGQFLSVLAAGCQGGQIGEIGTGAGIGTAWLASAMPADCALVTVDIDEQLAAAVGGLLADDDRMPCWPATRTRCCPAGRRLICCSPMAPGAIPRAGIRWSAW
jgi:predicted O-methyltransferase YrrM